MTAGGDSTKAARNPGSPIDADELDERFVPVPRDDAASIEIDGETVIVEGANRRVVHLDALGGLIWKCFDGSATIAELVDDLSEEFNADRRTVRDDVLDLTRQLGRSGLLVGVEADPPPNAARWREPDGLPTATQVPWAGFTEVGGASVDPEVRGRRATFLLNWRAECEFCEQISAELGELGPQLGAKGIDLVVQASETAETDATTLQSHVPGTTILIGEVGEGPDPFAGIGTPAAYLLDQDDRVVLIVAIGAERVLSLARAAAEGPGVER